MNIYRVTNQGAHVAWHASEDSAENHAKGIGGAVRVVTIGKEDRKTISAEDLIEFFESPQFERFLSTNSL